MCRGINVVATFELAFPKEKASKRDTAGKDTSGQHYE